MDNPFAHGEDRVIRPPATAMIIFGATGDLTHRKLLPALYNLASDGYFSDEIVVMGASRTKLSDQDFRKQVRESIEQYSRTEINEDVWKVFEQNLFYQPLDGTKQEDFFKLRDRLQQIGEKRSIDYNYLYYLATSPKFFGEISRNLRAAGLVFAPDKEIRRTSVVVEKPFGNDLVSAQELNRVLRENFVERQIFRIDHYLGKETVQNILVFRFANGIFEPLWNRNYIDHIQISVCESIGVGSRAAYFDQTGILRDIVQNHLIQMLSLICIEPPSSLSDPDSIRDEKVKVLRSIRRFSKDEVRGRVVRGQYAKGFIDGESVVGYLDEKGVGEASETESFVAMRLEIDNWRWSGVPIYVRAGKRLPKRITEITVNFKQPPLQLFAGRQVSQLEKNVLAIQVQPDEGITLTMNSKPPGMRLRVRPVTMDFQYHDSFGASSPEAYERLLLDAMRGEATLFTRDDEIEEAWSVFAPVLSEWLHRPDEHPVHLYEAGSWGCSAADDLIAELGHDWRKL